MSYQILLVTSEKDPVSVNVLKKLVENYGFKHEKDLGEIQLYKSSKGSLAHVKEDLLYVNCLDKYFKSHIAVFISRHESKERRPSLLVHATGNWTSQALYGGKPYQVSYTSATLLKNAIDILAEKAEEYGLTDKYHVSLEATHHGPTEMKTPLIFIEIGSTPSEWNDEKAVNTLSEIVIELLQTKVPSKDYDYYVGFGGPHYAPEFTKVMLRTDVAIGHIAPGYVFPMGVRNEVVQEAFEKVIEKPCKALIQWKGIKNPFRQNLVEFLKEKELEVVRLDKIKK